MLIVHLPPIFLVISQILVRWPFPVRSRQRMRHRQRMRGQPCMHGRPRIAWPVGGVNLRSLALLFWSLSCTHAFYGAVIVDPFFIVILTVTLREIAAVFVMLGCCEFRNKMYKCSCWVSLFCTFVLQFSVTVLLIVNVITEYLLLMVDIPSGMTLPGKLLQNHIGLEYEKKGFVHSRHFHFTHF